MRRIGFITNLSKDIDGSKTSSILQIANNLGMEALVSFDVHRLTGMGKPARDEDLFGTSDVIITLGGDGTLLHAAGFAVLADKPIMGINMGNLGFLTDTDFSQAKYALNAICRGQFHIDKRMMLKCEIIQDRGGSQQFVAFNDIGIMRSLVSRIIHLKVKVNQQELSSYSGDGLLVSSPTGSTAYSLSAGGPIVNPNVECLILTPICPHSLNSRSVITSVNDIIRIEVKSQDPDITLTADGQSQAVLKAGDEVLISKAAVYAKLIRTKDSNFFRIFHEKIVL
ncbi:MAG: NAD(+)/NADH kinase [Clostridiales bacterium]|nr:NAD(+)/NADH kinase [Clostridiales bacterium]